VGSESPEVEFSSETPSGPARCAFCLHAIASAPPVRCPRCEVGYHGECWRTNLQRCAVYGCEKAPFAPRVPRPVRPFRPAEEEVFQLRGWHLAWAAAVALILLVGLIGTLPSGPAPAPSYDPVTFELPDDPHGVLGASATLAVLLPLVNQVEELRELPRAGPERERLLHRVTQAHRSALDARAALRSAGAEHPLSPYHRTLQKAERSVEVLRDARTRLETEVRSR
jgi:hypothetical protein